MQLSVTAILLNYKRPSNIPRIVADLREAGCAEVWCWDNSCTRDLWPRSGVLFDRYHPSESNAGCSPRWGWAGEVDTDFTLVMDDDLTLSHDGVLISATQGSIKRGQACIGAYGRRLDPARSYGKCPLVRAGRADILLGRFILMPRDQARKVGDCPEKFEDDIYANSKFTAAKVVMPGLTIDLNPGASKWAVCKRPGHYQAREDARRRYFKK